jgi:GNAT superfamily N-acetyltransferase
MMPDFITDLTSEAATKAHIDNLIGFWSIYGNAPDGELQRTPEITSFISGVPFPLFNGVLNANLNSENFDTVVNSFIDRLKARRVPAFWWQGPTTEPRNLIDALDKYHFSFSGNTPAMAVDLQTAVLDSPLPDRFNIVEVKMSDIKMVGLYLQTLSTGSGIPDSLAELLLRAEQGARPLPNIKLQRYLGFLDGMPVATCALVLHAGVAGIYAVSTLPEARRKGYGSAITAVPLRFAYEQGYRVAVLQASELGFPIYRKIGFQTVFNFALHIWTGSPH